MADITSVVIQAKTDGIDAAVKSLDNLTNSAGNAEQATSGLGKATGDLSSTQSDNSSAIDKLLQKMQQSADLLGANTSQTNAYKAAMQGASDLQVGMAQMLGAEVDAYKSLGASQMAAMEYNRSLDASYTALQNSADAYYAQEAKNAAAMKALNDSGQRAADYAKIQDAQRALIQTTNDLAAAESKEKAIQQTRDYQTYISNSKAAAAALAAETKALADTAAAEAKAASDGKAFISSLTEQATRMSLTGDALKAYNLSLIQAKAAALGVSDQAAPLIASLNKTGLAAEGAHSGIAGITREFIVIGHEAMNGNFSRIPGSVMVLGEKFDMSKMLISGTTAAMTTLGVTGLELAGILLGVGAVVGVLVAGFITFSHSATALRDMNKEVILTGGYVGATADQLYVMADSIGKATGQIGAARAAIIQLAGTGKFTADQIGMITESALGLNTYGGVAIEATIKNFEKLAAEPLGNTEKSFHAVSKAALEVDASLHYLEPTILKQIIDSENAGKQDEARALSIKALHDAVLERENELKTNMSDIASLAHDVGSAFTNMWNSFFTKQSPTQVLAGLSDRLKNLTSADTSNWTSMSKTNNKNEIADTLAQMAPLQAKVLADQDAAQKKSDDAKANRAADFALNYMTALDTRTKGEDTLAIKLQRYEEQKQALLAAGIQTSKEEDARRIAQITKESTTKEKKPRPEGMSGLNTDLAGIQVILQTQLEADDTAMKSAKDLYDNKKIDVTQYSAIVAAKLQDESSVRHDAYVQSLTDLAIWASASNRTSGEISEAQSKITKLYSENEKAVNSLGIAITANGNLSSNAANKAYTDQLSSNDKITSGIQKQIDSIQAQVTAYNNLPNAIKAAGITSKQMQDDITQSYIDNKKAELAQAIENNNTEDKIAQAYIQGLTQEIDLLGQKQKVESQNISNQNANTFNLGIAARQKAEAAATVTYWNDASKSITADLTSVFGNSAAPMSAFFKAMTDGLTAQTAAQEKFNVVAKAQEFNPNLADKQAKMTAAQGQLDASNSANQMKQYGDMAGAAAGFFNTQSTGYKVLNGISEAFHIAELARTIATIAPSIAAGAAQMFAQGGFAGFAGVAAMVAIIGALGFAVAGGSGGGSFPTAAQQQATQGTGSIVGNTAAKSDSITKSLTILATNSGLGLVDSSQMVTYLKTIASGISGLASIIVQTTGLNSSSAAGIQTGTTSNIGFGSTASILDPYGTLITNILENIPLIGGLVSKLFNTTTSITDQGIQFSQQTLADIQANGVNAQGYANVESKSKFFGITVSDNTSQQLSTLPTDITSQFSMVVNSLANSINSAANTLGLGGDAFTQKLQSFVVDIGNISLKGLTGDQVNTALTAVFSKLGDDMAQFGISGLAKFEQVGEGYYQTLSRVVNDYVQVNDVLATIGQSFNVTGIAAVTLSEALIADAGDLATLTTNTKYFVTNFLSASQQIAPVASSVGTAMAKLGESSITKMDQFTNLVLAQDLSTSSGQAMYTALIALAPAFKAVADAAQKVTDQQHTEDINALTAQQNLATAQGNTTQANIYAAQILAIQRADELAALKLISPTLLTTQQQIYSLTDAATALTTAISTASAAFTVAKAATSTAFNVISASVTAAKNAATDAYNAQVAVTNNQITAVTAVNTAIGTLASSVQSALNSMLTSTATTLPTLASAQASLDNALTQAKSGNFVTSDSLTNTLSTLGQDNSALFSSYNDFAKSQGVTAGKLAELNTITGTAKTVSDQQLATLNDSLVVLKSQYDAQTAAYTQILSAAQLQLDAINGTNVAIMSITDALSSFNASILVAIAAAKGQAVAQGPTTTIGAGQTSTLPATNSDIVGLYTNLLGRAPDAGGLAFWESAAASGVSLSTITQDFISSPEYTAINGSHANGLDNVPFDGYTAKLHQGEMVLPAASAQAVRTSGTNEDIVSELRATCETLSGELTSMAKDINFMKKMFDRMSPNKNGLNTYTQTS